MAGRFLKYADLKDVHGLDIPSHWILSKVKYFGEYLNGYPFKPDNWSEDGVPIIRIQNLSNQAAEINKTEFLPPARYKVEFGDILISWSATLDVYIWAGRDAWLNQHIFKVSTNSDLVHNQFFYWAAKWFMGELNESSHGSTMQHLTADKFGGFNVPLPSIKEQETIANFLDHETAKIDTLIEKQQQLIQLLKEKRQAVISHAVTKGLNSNAKMRDSGVLSIGVMPEHWTLKSLSLASKKLAVGLAMSVTDCYEEEGIPIIRNQNIKEGYFDGGDMLYLNPAFAEAQASKKVKAGDVVIVRTGSNVGLACCVPDEYDQCHTFTTLIVTPSDELVKEYFTYCMNSAYGKAEVSRLKFGFGKDNLNVGELRAMHTLLPSIDEQKQIVFYLEQEVARIELIVKKAHIAIGLMQERRTALISAAVTGKIDVRDWVAPPACPTHKEVAA